MADHECLYVKEITELKSSIERLEERLDEHKERMDKLEESNKILHEMNTNIKVMIEQNYARDKKIEGIEKNVKEIIDKPRQNWEKVMWTIITVISTGVAMYLLGKLPEVIAFLTK